jgi:hypothetical protein
MRELPLFLVELTPGKFACQDRDNLVVCTSNMVSVIIFRWQSDLEKYMAKINKQEYPSAKVVRLFAEPTEVTGV